MTILRTIGASIVIVLGSIAFVVWLVVWCVPVNVFEQLPMRVKILVLMLVCLPTVVVCAYGSSACSVAWAWVMAKVANVVDKPSRI